jgi:uncharacterized membrane protein YfcA
MAARYNATAGQRPGMTVDPLLLVIMLASILVGGVVNGMIGIGFAVFVVNFLAAALGPKEAVIVMSVMAGVPSGYQLWRTRSEWATWIRLRSMLIGAVAGSLLGAQLLVLLPAWAISLGLGLVTGQFVIDQARRSGPPLSNRAERRMAPVAGFFSGMTNGALGAAGPVAGSFLLAIGLRGREFIFGISLMFTFMALVRIALFAVAGQYTYDLVLLGAILLIPTMFGQAVGIRLQRRTNPKVFQRLLLLVLFASSVSLFIRGGQGLLAFLNGG